MNAKERVAEFLTALQFDSMLQAGDFLSRIGIPANEAVDNLVAGFRPYFEYLQQSHPEAFVDGKLRDDWLEVVYKE